MTGNHERKVVLITGGTSGIGKYLVKEALSNGYFVAYCARNEPDEELKAFKSNQQYFYKADVSKPEDVESLFSSLVIKFHKIDLVFHCAGISAADLLVNTRLEDWQKIMKVNLTSSFLITKASIEQFKNQSDAGHIALFSSIAGYGAPSNACYATTKGGLKGLSCDLAEELSDTGITINSFILGFIGTPLTKDTPSFIKKTVMDASPLRRLGTPNEVAHNIFYLSNNSRKLINGRSIHVSGGLIDFPVVNQYIDE